MSKSPTYPLLYDECLQISISFLAKHGYLRPNQCKRGTVTWSTGEGEYKQVTGQINIATWIFTEGSSLELTYAYKGNPVNYQVELISCPSNLGKGLTWFFLCPSTGKRCRKLYCTGERFLHRQAFQGMYSKQTRSKRWRIWDRYFAGDSVLSEMSKPYFKSKYNGKYTKRYVRLLRRAKGISDISIAELLR